MIGVIVVLVVILIPLCGIWWCITPLKKNFKPETVTCDWCRKVMSAQDFAEGECYLQDTGEQACSIKCAKLLAEPGSRVLIMKKLDPWDT